LAFNFSLDAIHTFDYITSAYLNLHVHCMNIAVVSECRGRRKLMRLAKFARLPARLPVLFASLTSRPAAAQSLTGNILGDVRSRERHGQWAAAVAVRAEAVVLSRREDASCVSPSLCDLLFFWAA
jgi:hypothetical protein